MNIFLIVCFTTTDIYSFLQFIPQSSSVSPQVGFGIGVQAPSLNSIASPSQLQTNSIHQQSSQLALTSTGPKDAGMVSSLLILILLVRAHASTIANDSLMLK